MGCNNEMKNAIYGTGTIGDYITALLIAIDFDKRITGAATVEAHTTSMLQDSDFGRPLKIDALVTTVLELAHIVDVKIPIIDTVLLIVQQRDRKAGCY